MAYQVIMALLGRLGCSIILIWMAVPKITNPSWLLELSIGWLPDGLAWLFGNILPWGEISLGLLLVSPVLWRPAARLTCLLLLGFVPVLLIFALEGRVDCGCGGSGSVFPPWASSPLAGLVRNAVMIITLGLAFRAPSVKLTVQ